MFSRQILSRWALLSVAICTLFTAGVITAQAQSSVFTYQGRLTDAGTTANGVYDFEFRLFNDQGVQIGPVVSLEDVQVVKGVFTANLDFGAQAFDGTARSLEVAVRPGTSTDAFTTLAPRQSVSATPYSLRTLSAAKADAADNATTTQDSQKLGGVAAAQYVKTDDPRLVAGGGPPAPGSPNYIQNGTAAQAASFNVSGDGTAGGTLSGKVVSAATQFNLGSHPVLRAAFQSTSVGLNSGSPNSARLNSFFGVNAGQKTTRPANSFFGASAGSSNTTGEANSFFGSGAGEHNIDGKDNSFFGSGAGFANMSGQFNSFFGFHAGTKSTGDTNSFFGFGAGESNETGHGNSFFGFNAGESNETGHGNSFFGETAGLKLATGNGNTFVGTAAGVGPTVADALTSGSGNTFIGVNTYGFNGTGSAPLVNATAIGANASVTKSNSLVLGPSGLDGSVNVGIGTSAPNYRLQVMGGNIAIGSAGKGLILKSPDGTVCKAITLTNQGTVLVVNATCP